MTATRDDGSFFEKFRQRREDKRRLDALRAQAEGLRDRVAADVSDRVIRDLARRSHEVEETERQELKSFVQGLKERREELKRTEHEIDELDFRKLIGEIDDVELQIRKESLALKVREQRRFLERDLEEYRALRSFVDKDELPPGLTKAESVVESASGGPAPAAVHESTVTFDSFRMKRSAALATPPPPPPSAPVIPPVPAEHPAPPSPVAAVAPAPSPAPAPVSAPAPAAAAPAAAPASRPSIPVPPSMPKMPTAPPAPARSRVEDPMDPPTVRVGSKHRESKPTARPAALPPLVVHEAQESIIVNQDFLAKAPAADDALDGLDDLSQLDALSKSLDRMARSDRDLSPIRMPSALRGEEAGAHLFEGIPSSPSLQEEESESTIVKRPDSQTLNVPQPMLILKNKDGTERASFVLKLGVSTMGRGLDNECVLDDRAVSRKHSTITFESDGTFRLTDLGSENGTYVNGQRITTHVLKDGDEVHIGKSTLVFSLGK